MRKSPFFYVGDKFKILKQILPYFPDNIERFIEPFLGGGSVFLNINAKLYLLNDIDKNIVSLHETLFSYKNKSSLFISEVKDILDKHSLSKSYFGETVSTDLKNEFKKTYYAVYNKAGYNNLRNEFNLDKNNIKLYILLIYGFNRFLRFNKKGEFNLPVGNVDFNKNVYNALHNYFEFVNNKKIQYSSLDFECFIKSIKFKQNDFIYFDPPYLISNSEYNKIWNDDKEYNLLKTLDELSSKKVKWAISNIVHYKDRENNIFKKWAMSYNVYDIKSNYISYNDNSIKYIKEVLVTNYEQTN